MRNRKYQHINNPPVSWTPRSTNHSSPTIRIVILFLVLLLVVAISLVGNPNRAMLLLP